MKGRNALPTFPNDPDQTLRNIKAQSVESLWRRYPSLESIESDLQKEASKLVVQLISSPEQTEATLRRVNALRKKRKLLLQFYGLADDYAQTAYTCPLCKDLQIVQAEDRWQPCSCTEKKKIETLYLESGLTQRMRKQTFATFRPDVYSSFELVGEENNGLTERDLALKTLNTANDFVSQIIKGNNPKGLYIYGPTGVGKTHLIVAMANMLIENGFAVKYIVVTQFLSDLRTSYNANNNERTTEDEHLQLVLDAPILILDDLGAERFTDWSVEKLYHIISYRYDRELPTLITSNYFLDRLEELVNIPLTMQRIVSRIVESCKLCGLSSNDQRFKRS